MKKIMIACALCVVAGASAGYVGGKWLLPNNEAKQEAVAENSPDSRFSIGAAGQDKPGDEVKIPFILGDRSLDLYMKIKKGEMTPEQLKEQFRLLMEEMKGRGNRFSDYNENLNSEILRELGRQWGLSAPRQALAELAKDHTERMRFVRGIMLFPVLSAWAEKDPEAVAQYYMENRKNLGSYGPSLFLGKWAETDPEAAWRNLESLNSQEKTNSTVSFFDSVLKFHPDKAREFMDKLDKILWADDDILWDLITLWGKTDTEGMNEWIGELGSEQQEKWKPCAIMSMMVISPEKAGKAFSLLSPGDQARSLDELSYRGLGNSRVDKDVMSGREVIDWISKYASQEVQAEKIPQFIGYFERESPAGLYDWLKKLPEGKLRENALIRYSGMFGWEGENYSSRLELIQTLPNEDQRNSALRNIITDWARTNPEKAKEWIRSSSLQEQAKEEWISYADKFEAGQSKTSLFTQ